MPRGNAISKEIRELVVQKIKNGRSYKDVGTELNLPKSTVQYIFKSYKKNNSLDTNYKNCGKISNITQRDIRSLDSIIKKNRRSTVRSLAAEWSLAVGRTIGRETTRKYVNKLGYGFYKVSMS